MRWSGVRISGGSPSISLYEQNTTVHYNYFVLKVMRKPSRKLREGFLYFNSRTVSFSTLFIFVYKKHTLASVILYLCRNLSYLHYLCRMPIFVANWLVLANFCCYCVYVIHKCLMALPCVGRARRKGTVTAFPFFLF